MDKNIFQAASNAYLKRKRANKDLPLTKNECSSSKKIESEMDEMFKKMDAMQQDLNARLEHLYSKGKERHIDVEKLIGDRFQLSNKEKDHLHVHEKQILKKIDEIIPPESCLKPRKKTKEQLMQERRSKTRGARKNWLPMH